MDGYILILGSLKSSLQIPSDYRISWPEAFRFHNPPYLWDWSGRKIKGSPGIDKHITSQDFPVGSADYAYVGVWYTPPLNSCFIICPLQSCVVIITSSCGLWVWICTLWVYRATFLSTLAQPLYMYISQVYFMIWRSRKLLFIQNVRPLLFKPSVIQQELLSRQSERDSNTKYYINEHWVRYVIVPYSVSSRQCYKHNKSKVFFFFSHRAFSDHRSPA